MRVPSLPFHQERSGWHSAFAGWLLWAGLLVGLVRLLPQALPWPDPASTLLAFGAIGVWRWSWGGTHLVRAFVYSRLVFPRVRRLADRAAPPSALYVVVTSYRLPQPVNAAVYGRLFNEIAGLAVPTVVVACVSDHADAIVVEDCFARRHLPEGTRVEIIAQRNRGKRDAMAAAFDLIAAEHAPAGAQVVLMDGDTLLDEGALRRTCAVLCAEPRVGAVTTDNVPVVKGSAFTREWYRLRMVQRHNLMASLSLSRRVLVLTGRFSVFKAELATSSGFVNALGRDHVDHRRLGRIAMLTGDDKSTWFETLRLGWQMLYVPDVVVHPVEELPAGGFLEASCALMVRWYGNMVRNNSRALGLGPSRCGWFFWIALLDQRLSMWTSLVGPSVAAVLSVAGHWSVLIVYAIWILISRILLAGLYATVTGRRVHPFFAFALFYNQLVGSAIKVFVLHHPDKQRWTRQAGTRGCDAPRRSFGARLSTPFLIVAVGTFLLFAVVMAGTLDVGQRKTRPWSVSEAFFSSARPAAHAVHPATRYRSLEALKWQD